MREQFKGVFTALVTPFIGGQVDYTSISRLVERQIKDGVKGFVVHGTTGESPTTTIEEKKKIFDCIKEMCPKGFPLIVGTGTNSTAETIKMSLLAQEWGADAVLVVVPYYNKPPQRGLIEHFNAVANSLKIPVILYNVPSRTVVTLELETILTLSKNPNIIGIKEATGKIELAEKIRKACPKDFILLSGDDGTYDDFCRVGGDGVISVTSHIFPAAMLNRRTSEFKRLTDLLFSESNPIPVKAALHLMQTIRSPELRLPLVKMEEDKLVILKEELRRHGLLT